MLTIQGDRQRFCDGVSRREFLQIGSMALGGWTLADLLATEARAGVRNRHKAVINIFLPGGPSHQDMFDLKMEAPAEIRGEFKPIKTNVPGIEISEYLPKLAAITDKLAIIRSLVGARDEHANPICVSGYTLAEQGRGHPGLGPIISRVWGPVEPTIPAQVDLIPKTQHQPYSFDHATGFLGRAHAPVRPSEAGMADMVLNGISLSRLRDRQKLLASVDRFRRTVDHSDAIAAADVATQQAFNILTSPRFVEALDVSREDAKVLERYGKGQDTPVGDAAPCKNEHFLAARRLVEVGVRCVTVGYGFWDWHGGNFPQLKKYLPMFDHAVSTLILDLHERGLDKDVSVVVWGEFGRTPKINSDGGRDHWPPVSCALLAGGGMRTGQVIGSTTPDGGYADERPVHYRDVMATLLYNLGFDIRSDQVIDQLDRPQYLFPEHAPIPELI